MSKKATVSVSLLCAAALVLSVIALVIAGGKGKSGESADIQYVMYLGTNDKDTNEPVFAPEEAKERAEEILVDYFGGYTIQEASGGWAAGDNLYQEYTIVIYLSDTDLEHVHAAADELVRVFRQSSVLIQQNRTTTEFYSGGE